MNIRMTIYILGILLIFEGGFMAVPTATAAYFHEPELLLFAVIAAALLLAGIIITRFKPANKNLFARDGFVIVALSWLVLSFFGALPFWISGTIPKFVDAMFESVSGFTTTGASILNDIEALPRGLQFWRISTAWVGGVGIVTLFSMITAGADKSTLSGAEIPTVAREPFAGDRSTSFANRMFLTYIALTLVTFFSLKLTGMAWFDAATNAMSACSTCGFCTRNTSIAFYANPAAEVVLTFAMLAAGVHFGILFLAILRGRPKYIWKSETIKVFLSLVVLAIVVVTADLMVNGHYPSFGEALRDASFQVASISTTTGFATQDTTLWPPLSMSILIICSLICGCSGSTSGGIKIDRAILAAKGIYRKVGLTVSPHRVQAVRVDGRMRSDELVNDAYGYIFCYLLIVVVFAAVNLSFGLDFTTGVTASVACIGNVGPGFGEVGSMSNFAAFPAVLKATSMTEMLIGRLEIFPILYLLRSIRIK